MNALLSRLARTKPATVDSIERLVARVRELAAESAWPFERAVIAGFEADRIAFAFGAGYEAALAELVPSSSGDRIRALCVTEAGGGHPQSIAARLAPRKGGGFTLDAKKRWATFGPLADELLIVASTGTDASGRNRLAVVKVDATRATVVSMPPTPFAPELPHAEIVIDGAEIRDDDVLPGDGYDRYVKPFRTIEDIHVMGALAGHIAGIARRSEPALFESALALIAALTTLARLDPLQAETHLALAGVLELVPPMVDRTAAALSTDDDAKTRWERDRALVGVAGGVRAKRLEAARKKLSR
jgi:acyl-CoA dehydrogenase